jgi:hypothetical protein
VIAKIEKMGFYLHMTNATRQPTTMTTHPARAFRAARLRAQRAAAMLRHDYYAARYAAEQAATLAGTLPPYPREGTTGEKAQWWIAEQAAIATPEVEAAQSEMERADAAIGAMAAGYRTARAPLMRPADPTKPRDSYTLTGATHGPNPLPKWDDGYGPTWLALEEFGAWLIPCGIVRARTWEDACECALDEIVPDFDFQAHDIDPETIDPDNPPEGLEWRGSGNPINGKHFPRLTTPYADSAGITLKQLTKADLGVHNIALQWNLTVDDRTTYNTTTPAPTP